MSALGLKINEVLTSLSSRDFALILPIRQLTPVFLDQDREIADIVVLSRNIASCVLLF